MTAACRRLLLLLLSWSAMGGIAAAQSSACDRECLIGIAEQYCDRIENGARTTNAPGRGGAARPDPKTAGNYSAMWTCREQFESGLLHFVSRIRDRRYVAVDQERGLVLAFAFFDHDAGASRTFQTPSGRTVTAGPVTPWTWQIAELFKVEKGLLHEIDAVLERVPYGMTSGWSSWEDGMSDKIQFSR